MRRSLGPDLGDIGRDFRNLRWSITPAWYGGFWSADRNRLRFIKWTSGGEIIEQYERRPEWLPKPVILSAGSPTRPPSSAPAGISSRIPVGMLWTFTRVAAPTWAEAYPKGIPQNQREVKARLSDSHKLFESIVEVLDMKTHRVIASVRLREVILQALPGGRAVALAESKDGLAYIDIKQYPGQSGKSAPAWRALNRVVPLTVD